MRAEIHGLEVAFAKVRVTPERPVYLAGLSRPRLSRGVHDDLYVRCMVMSHGGSTVALVGVDSIGLPYADVSEVKGRLLRRGVLAVVASTHDHSSPDTIGLWGPDYETSGVDPEYLSFLKGAIAECVEEACGSLRRARLTVSSAQLPEGVAKNSRDPGLIDREVTVLAAESYQGERLGIAVNFGLHPEVLSGDNLLITADFPHYMLSALESRYGGVGLFLNGALGGMVTPDVREHSFAEAERVGVAIAAAALEALAGRAAAHSTPELLLVSKEVELPVHNRVFIELVRKGVLRKLGDRPDRTVSVVSYFRLSPLVEGVSLPGEPLPKVGLRAKALLRAPFRMLVGLGDDEIGYIIDAEDWTEGRYEESMSLGPLTSTILLGELSRLVELARRG